MKIEVIIIVFFPFLILETFYNNRLGGWESGNEGVQNSYKATEKIKTIIFKTGKTTETKINRKGWSLSLVIRKIHTLLHNTYYFEKQFNAHETDKNLKV